MVLIQDHIDIQYKSFVINGITQPDGIGNDYRRNIGFLHMKQGTDESLQDKIIPL